MKNLFIGILLILVITLVTSEDCIKVYKLEKDNCGELCLSKYIAKFAIQFGGVKEGDCLSLGYNVFDHKENISVGPFGNFEVTIYKKPTIQDIKFLEN